MGYTREHRQKAAALNAADARTLISKSLPSVLKIMTPAQLEQAQRVMDAAVVNPVVKKEYEDAMRRSIVSEGRDGGNYEGVYLNGRMVTRDVNLARRAERMNQPIPVTAADYSIRVDFTMLLAPDAFTSETDNPDETAYMNKIKSILSGSGVWLRIGQPQVSAFVVDPRVFSVWLSVGPNGDDFFTIPTKDGQLTRGVLLKSKTLGAGYARDVVHGYVLETLRSESDRLARQINAGMSQHMSLQANRVTAFPGVTAISEAVGGASFPPLSIWDLAHRLLIKSMNLRVGGGNVTASRAYLLAAAAVTRKGARLIAEYIDDIDSGAGKAVVILKVADTAGDIAEIGLAVTGATALVRGGAKMAAKGAASEVDVLLEKELNKMIAKDATLAHDIKPALHVPQPKGTVLGGSIKNKRSVAADTGWDKW